MAVTVYAWGYGDILENTLNGISMLVTQADYVTWIKIAVLIGMAVIITVWLRGRTVGEGGFDAGLRTPWYPITYFLVTYFIFMLFVRGPQVDVIIEDRVTGHTGIVNNVPIGIGYTLSLFSTFEERMTENMETFLGVPSSLRFSNSGLFAGVVALKNAVDMRIRDERLMANMNNFSVDCVIPGVLAGDISRENLLQGDFIEELSNVNPALVTTYVDASGTKLVVDCQTALENIQADLNIYTAPTGEAFSWLSKITGLGTNLSVVFNDALTYFLGYSGSAQDCGNIPCGKAACFSGSCQRYSCQGLHPCNQGYPYDFHRGFNSCNCYSSHARRGSPFKKDNNYRYASGILLALSVADGRCYSEHDRCSQDRKPSPGHSRNRVVFLCPL